MKKVMLIIAGALFIGVAAQAQDPSTNLKADSTVTTPTPPADPTAPAQPAPQTTPQDPTLQSTPAPSTPTPTPPAADQAPSPSYRKDMTKIDNATVPEGLKSTLTNSQFKGWEETGAVYSNADKSVYIVEIKDEMENRVKAFRFDSNGKPIKE